MHNNRMYHLLIIPLFKEMYNISIVFRDVFLDQLKVQIPFFQGSVDFVRINYCITSIHGLVGHSTKNVLRTFSLNPVDIPEFLKSVTDLYPETKPSTFLEHLIFILILYGNYFKILDISALIENKILQLI